jgi:hypothetical protein
MALLPNFLTVYAHGTRPGDRQPNPVGADRIDLDFHRIVSFADNDGLSTPAT